VEEVAFIYGERTPSRLERQFHLLEPTRLRCTFHLLRAYGAFDIPVSLLLQPEPCSEEQLLLFHTPDYVEAVRRFSHGDIFTDPSRYNFSDWGDNPIFDEMYESACQAVGGSLKAAHLILAGKARIAFNIAGGLHHAGPNFASGFCIFNDAAIVIKDLLQRGLRVAYVDIDAHHGDGVQNAFYDTDQVLTISIHESGRYLFPGTGEVSETGSGRGRGYSVNLPLAPHTDDEVYLWAFEQVVPPLLDAFKAPITVTQLGIDTHYLDPLAHLALTTHGYTRVIQRLKELCPRWVALGGGGYDMAVVARAWTLAYGVMVGREWPNEIPLSYQERYGIKRLHDEETPSLSDASRRYAWSTAQAAVEAIHRTVFPYHGLRS